MSRRVIIVVSAILLLLAALLAWSLLAVPNSPVAQLRVTDASGKPIPGAIIRPEGLRTKPGPYVSGWYAWPRSQKAVPASPVKTDAEGYARVPYPKYVFERIETGTLCLGVEHPDYVPDRPERMVAFAPPAGAPWRVWANFILGRFNRKAVPARTDPIILQPGAILELSVHAASPPLDDSSLFAQVSGMDALNTNFWVRPMRGLLVTRRLRAGNVAVRAVQLDSHGAVWFGPTTNITAVSGQTNKVAVELTPGVAVHGRLDDSVPRPVRNGRVIAQVWPSGEKPQNYPPDWHAWAEVRPDGTFDISYLPAGDLELVALCEGFVSTNGPGQFPSMHYPQKFALGTNDLSVTLGMEPTAAVEAVVTDDQDKPLKDAQVSSWPNVRYGEWSATIIGDDRYNTADSLRPAGKPAFTAFWERPSSFQATSDASGLAFIQNLPAEANEIGVEHPRFVLPAVSGFGGEKRRQLAIHLLPGQTNRITVRLEPKGQSAIAHY